MGSQYDLGSSSKTDFDNNIDEFQADAVSPDAHSGEQDETYFDFPDADNQYGNLENSRTPLKQSLYGLANWVFGLGYEAEPSTKFTLDHLKGNGKDSAIDIFKNIFIQSKTFGCGFAHAIRNKENTLINLKPLYPGDIRLVFKNDGMLKEIQQKSRKKGDKPKPYKLQDIFMLYNDRFVNEMNGTSVVKSVQWAIDALSEALGDERKIKHRDLALGILYYKGDNATKRDQLITQYQDAVNKGDVLVLPDGIAELRDSGVTPQQRLDWIRFLRGYIYEAVGISQIIAGSQEQTTNIDSKMGHFVFEQVYKPEQLKFENAMWNQLAIKIKLNVATSLKDDLQASEAKNTGQVGFQPNESEVSMVRSE